MSRPTWARGLKRGIDTVREIRKQSRPTWARGLKRRFGIYLAKRSESRPTWARGLKLSRNTGKNQEGFVAPHVGAWIETFPLCWNWVRGLVAPHVGAWIETEILEQIIQDSFGRAPRGRVD